MKILLVGEYSRLHNSLKEGLIKAGQEVTIIGKKDSFKNYPVEFSLENRIFKNKPLLKIAKIIDKIFKVNFVSIENYLLFYFNRKRFKGYDVVQFINESFLKTSPNLEIRALKYITNHNKKTFLLCCGIDYVSLRYAFDKKFNYSILSPYFENPENKKEYVHILNVLSPKRLKIHNAFKTHANGFISSDLDYHIPYKAVTNYLGMIPNPINTDLITYKEITDTNKIIIFHGVNTETSVRKGSVFFDKALQIIQQKYASKIEVIRTENIPYNTYINYYNSCHILLDQVYAYDQGYNALEAMAKGKVVFTGAEKDWLDYYNLKEDTVAINALPNVDYLVEKLAFLIENPEKIIEISKNARNFILQHHHYEKQAKQYLDLWNKAQK